MFTTRRNRQTKTLVTVGNAIEDGYCTEGGNYYTVCEDHASILNYETKAEAIAWASSPRDWCDECRNN